MWIRRAGFLLAGLIAVCVTAVLLGLTLPESHHATSSTTLAVARDLVFDRLAHFERYPDWRTGVERVEALGNGPGGPIFREHNSQGPLTMAVEELVAPSRLKARIADDQLPFGGTWTWELTATEAGTRVQVTEDGEIYNPVFRVFARFVFGYNGTMETYLRDLATSFELPPPAIHSEWRH